MHLKSKWSLRRNRNMQTIWSNKWQWSSLTLAGRKEEEQARRCLSKRLQYSSNNRYISNNFKCLLYNNNLTNFSNSSFNPSQMKCLSLIFPHKAIRCNRSFKTFNPSILFLTNKTNNLARHLHKWFLHFNNLANKIISKSINYPTTIIHKITKTNFLTITNQLYQRRSNIDLS